MNSKGQIVILRLIVISFTFLMLWPFLAPVVNTQTEIVAAATPLDPLEGFFLANIHLSVFIMFIIFIIAVGFMASLIT